jgi:hypothetical protein
VTGTHMIVLPGGGMAALAPGAEPDQAVQFAVLGYPVTSMEN